MTPEREEELLERLVIAIEQLADNIEGVRLLMEKEPKWLIDVLGGEKDG